VRALLHGCAVIGLLPWQASSAPAQQSAAGIAAALGELRMDPAQSYRVRDLQLVRGDVKLYLTEGVVTLTAPIEGRVTAAVFTTADSEGGDGEILVLPPRRSERASLASFTKSANLDEHFSSALFFFGDDTANDLLSQIRNAPLRPAPEMVPDVASMVNGVLRRDSAEIEVRVLRSLLENRPPDQGFFFGIIAGRNLGTFDVAYEPGEFEPVSLGQTVTENGGEGHFRIWTSYRPAHAPLYVPPVSRIADYRLETEIHADLSMSAVARFRYKARESDGRVVALDLAARLRVSEATIDGHPVEVFAHRSDRGAEARGNGIRDVIINDAGTFLLIAGSPLAGGSEHQIEVHYSGSVIHQTSSGSYFVDERNAWYPFTNPLSASFDLTFRCPENLRLVSTGELVSETVAAGTRTVHRRTQDPEPLAGFNLGDYMVSGEDHGRYHIDVYSDKGKGRSATPAFANEAGRIVDYYSEAWTPLPSRSLAISPIEGYFGQGFPGLIYLSSLAYVPEQERPALLRGGRFHTFFSQVLLPHEIAHQWWGNRVRSADYRTSWLTEAMASYAALEYLERTQGRSSMDAILKAYRDDLKREQNGASIESAGPVDFGERLLDNNGLEAWHLIVYEKGAWILHMLRKRLGDGSFEILQRRLLAQYASKPLNNEDLRRVAAELLPPKQPDRSLEAFFDTWVYGTGIPEMKLHAGAGGYTLRLSGVDEDFTLEVPLRCNDANGRQEVRWVRALVGDNQVDVSKRESCQLPASNEFLSNDR
jgi:hypothetical protein